MSKNHGGAAFPNVSLYHEKDGTFTTQADNHGMTLRDYFAAKAMQGMLASPYNAASDQFMTARDAYKIADAMLLERVK